MKQSKVKTKFTTIYHTNHWENCESVSGPGSTVERTSELREKLQDVLRLYEVGHLLDLPCGDFNWMKHVNLSGIVYLGGDIVRELVTRNNQRYSSDFVAFEQMDLVSSELPKVDMIFCRDALVHLPDDMVVTALHNIKRSNSTYLVTTTFPDVVLSSKGSLGGWRPINLEDSKFRLSKPEEYILEDSSPSYGRKAMGVWRIDEI
jgi:hypothetical protein